MLMANISLRATGKSLLKLVVLALLTSLILPEFANGDENNKGDNSVTPDVNLTIATVLSSTDVLSFSMTNLSQKDIYMQRVTSPPCYFVLIDPNGEETVTFTAPSDNYWGPPIRPGKTQQWKVNISEQFGRVFIEKGTYRLTWIYRQKLSEKKTIEIKSNEFLILKDENS